MTVEAGLASPPEVDIDPFTPENLRDPEAVQTAIRETAPVVRLKKYDMYAIGRHDLVQTALSDYTRFTSTGGIGMSDIRKPGAWRTPSPIAEVDPPGHSAVRRTLQRVLSPVIIRQWRDDFMAEAEKQADTIIGSGTVEAVSDLVEPFILKVFPDALGVDMPREAFPLIGEMNFNQIGPNNDLTKASIEAAGPHLKNYEQYFSRESMIAGGLGEKIYQAEDEGGFPTGTAGVQVRSFLRAGVDTTIAGIGHMLLRLAQNPDQWAKLKADPSKAKAAFDEAIRMDSPSQLIHRTTVSDMEFGGLALKGDVKVGCFIGAANLDPRKFSNPTTYDIDRNSAGTHVALGAGPHICIGQNIARLEAEVFLGALLKRFSRIELDGDPEYKTINTLRSLDRLPLRLVS